jgi:hypothetical protein
MYGTVASAFSPLLYSVIITLLGPEDFDWTFLSKSNLAVADVDEIFQSSEGHGTSSSDTKASKKPQVTEASEDQVDTSEATQRRWSRYALFWAIATFLGHWVLWPLPMYAAKFIFGKRVSDCQTTTPNNLLTITSSLLHGLWLPRSGCG